MFKESVLQTEEYTPPDGWKVPVLLRASVAEILGITGLTLRNREDKGLYPRPRRNEKNNYRIYSVVDVCNLQYITNGKVYLPPILSVLYDAGYTDIVPLQGYLHHCMTIFKKELEDRKSVKQLTLAVDDAPIKEVSKARPLSHYRPSSYYKDDNDYDRGSYDRF